jgi:iron complex outermembrane receptor protein
VSKVPEPLRNTPAALYVITHDDILRSGATSIPEILRLAPNLLVAQLTSSSYTAAARGFGGNPDVQNFSNKLLILIDGRSVYSPLFSGIYYDAQDVVIDDIDRIEVISGPGATLWGANAMNGVINIITRPAYLTTGPVVTAGIGTMERNVSARYGGRTRADTAFRVYAKAFERDALDLDDGSDAGDAWYKGQAGFRVDWSAEADAVTAQGDIYRGIEDQPGVGKQVISGANLLGRWQHHTERSEVQLQAYIDQSQRSAPADGVAFVVHTADLELQQSLMLGTRQRFVWGAGYRLISYGITNSAALSFIPPERDLRLSNIFAQDTIALTDSLRFTLGVKLENPAYANWVVHPDARLAWQASSKSLLWVAASHAIRSATPFDADVVEKVGSVVFLTGNPDFRTEKVVSYEMGYRGEPSPSLSVSVSAYVSDYDDLRTVETASSTAFLPLRWDNLMEGQIYGLTAWAKWEVADWWRLSPGLALLHKELKFSPGASRLLSLNQAGNDPNSRATLTSSMDLGARVTLDAMLRYIGSRPEPALHDHYNLSARLSWQVSPAFELAVTGSNLLHSDQLQYPAPNGERIGRSAIVEARWRP